ncbi:MAG: AI-2E family transporter, partial [Rhodospirillales bacterium]|nr:AI-2E family transporter [Rhodospirillales bacterium]
MTRTHRMITWGLGLVVVLILLHMLSGILLPFVAGMAVAYFLDPVADWMESKGLSRLLATVIITLSFFLIVALGLAMLFPLLQGQIIAIADRVPDLVALVQSMAEQARAYAESVLPADAMQRAGDAASDYSGTLMGWLKAAATRVWSGGMALFQLVSMILIMPIVSFYMLLEWDRIVARMDHLLPRGQAPVIREQLSLIDQTISAFVRGQASVCLVLATFYAIALTMVGLETGLLIGLGAGLISFIPYVGAMTGISIGVGVALVQFDGISPVLSVAAIFIVGQVCESYLLTPKLVGSKVGLHDLWIIFALMAGGTLFG